MDRPWVPRLIRGECDDFGSLEDGMGGLVDV